MSDNYEAARSCYGRRIVSMALHKRDGDDSLIVQVDGGDGFEAWDGGQDCCESRYMTVDDDLTQFVGATLLDVDVVSGGSTDDDYGDVHEIEFLVIRTDRGDVRIANHNEHNGYYGGFNIKTERRKESTDD